MRACLGDFQGFRAAASLLAALTLAAMIPTTVLARDPATAPPRFDEKQLRADVTFLASPPLGGRLSLQPGDDVAAFWVASEFAKAGLKPAAMDATGALSYLQAVPLQEYVTDKEAVRLVLRGDGGEVAWASPQIYYPATARDVDIQGQLVFAGYGVTAPELGYDDYCGLDVRGKVVVIFDHEPQEASANSRFAGKGNTLYASRYMKVLNAQRRGAVAVLIAPEPLRRHPTAQELRDRIGHQADHAANPIPSQALLDGALKIPSLLITDPVAERILAPLGRSSDLQAKIDEDLTTQSAPLPGSVVKLTLRVAARREATAWNVAGLLEGTDPTLAPETIIIAAHHDHDGESGGKIWAGADDNASGVAGVVALARAFAARPERPRRSLLFIAFAAEERGLLGAQYYTEHPLRPLATTRAVINFDMIGRNEEASPHTDGLIETPNDTSLRLNLVGATYSRDYLRVLEAENRRVGLVLDDRFDHEPALNTLFRSDQFPFLLHGVPAVWWFTGFHRDYHHPTDTAEKINYAKMALILRLAYFSASRFASDGKPPRLSAPATPTRNSACEIAAGR